MANHFTLNQMNILIPFQFIDTFWRSNVINGWFHLGYSFFFVTMEITIFPFSFYKDAASFKFRKNEYLKCNKKTKIIFIKGIEMHKTVSVFFFYWFGISIAFFSSIRNFSFYRYIEAESDSIFYHKLNLMPKPF